MTATPATDTDPRPLLGTAMDQVDLLIADVPPEALDRPTPCAEFDLRTLLRHVVGVLRRIRHVAAGGDPFAVPHVVDDEIADHEWPRVYRDARAGVDEVWADDAVLDRVLKVPWAELPGRGVALGYVMELTVHAWDIARCTGQTGRLDPALAEVALDAATRFVPAESRGGHVPFGPVVQVGDSSGPYERLAGWLGRHP